MANSGKKHNVQVIAAIDDLLQFRAEHPGYSRNSEHVFLVEKFGYAERQCDETRKMADEQMKEIAQQRREKWIEIQLNNFNKVSESALEKKRAYGKDGDVILPDPDHKAYIAAQIQVNKLVGIGEDRKKVDMNVAEIYDDPAALKEANELKSIRPLKPGQKKPTDSKKR